MTATRIRWPVLALVIFYVLLPVVDGVKAGDQRSWPGGRRELFDTVADEMNMRSKRNIKYHL